jgi:hypothetical protein
VTATLRKGRRAYLHKRHVACVRAEETGRPPAARVRPVLLCHDELGRLAGAGVGADAVAHSELVVNQRGQVGPIQGVGGLGAKVCLGRQGEGGGPGTQGARGVANPLANRESSLAFE